MYLHVHFNPRHESDRFHSFLEVLAASGNEVTVVVGPEDLKDPDGEITLENAGVSKYVQKLSNRVVFEDISPEDYKLTELYLRVNT